MTEEQLEIASVEKETSVASEDETQKPPMKAPKKSPLIAIIAVIAVIALIATAFAVMIMGGVAQKPYLDIKFSPPSISMPNGSQVRLYAFVNLKNSSDDTTPLNISNSVNLAITVKWQAGDEKLGDITPGFAGSAKYWQFESRTEGTSALNWSFKYRDPSTHVDYWANKSTSVVISVAELDYISILPPDRMLLINTGASFTAEAYLTNGIEVAASLTWALDNASLGTITDTSGPTTNFTAGGIAMEGNLTCTGTYSGKSVSSKAPITIISALPDAETHSRFYDLFNVPLQDFWNERYQEKVFSKTYPVSYVWLGAPSGNNWVYSNCRMNVSATNISTANTYTNPVYVPVTNPNPLIRGGNIRIDWVADYLTFPEIQAQKYGGQIEMWYDSWYFELNGTISMDKVASKMVLNITDKEFDNFNDWKTNKFSAFTNELSSWLLYEMNTRVAIRFAYEWDGNSLFEKYDINKVGDEIVLTIKDYLSWGMESLLGRWWRDTFLAFEGWPADLHFKANIGPLWSDFSLDTCLEYGIIAKTSTRGNQPCWVFEQMHADAVAGTASKLVDGKWVNYSSEMNPYVPTTGYWNFLVANAYYNTLAPYDYTPWTWNLSARDSWSIEWPSTGGIVGYNHNGTGSYTNNVTGHVDPIWIEPLSGEVPANMAIDWTTRKITIDGPFDSWTWSKTTGGSHEIRDNWSRIGMLPRGDPYMEFGVNSVADTVHDPITVLSIPTVVQYVKDAHHNYYVHRMYLNTLTTLKSAGFDIGGTAITNYHWEFGDGTTANTATSTTTHTWSGAERNVTLNLTVTNSDGHSSTDSRLVNLSLNMPPTASFVAPIGVIQLQTSLDASASSDLDGSIVSYDWEFGDGTTDSVTTPTTTHQYAKMGNYQVNLTVVDNEGATDTDSRNVGIQTELCAKIIMPDRAAVNQVVTLSGAKSFTFAGAKTITNYHWEFGDGTMADTTSATTTHTWTTIGVRMVNLSVKDSAGLWSPNASSRLYVGTDTIAALSVSLSRHSLFPGESATLTIKAVDSAGKKINAAFTVDVSANKTGWTGLSAGISLTGGVWSGTISCTLVGAHNITAIIQGNPLINGSEFATIANRTIEIKIYDFMQFPLGSYWEPYRMKWGDKAFRSVAPTYELYATDLSKLLWTNLDTTYRVNVTARHLNEINMTNPTFFPKLNTNPGGKMYFVMDYHYLDLNEFWWWNALVDTDSSDGISPQNPYTWSPADQANFLFDSQFSLYNQNFAAYDGWETFMYINMTMDRSAAYQLIGLPLAGNPITWWDTWYWNGPDFERGNDTIKKNIENFMVAEGGGMSTAGRLDIRCCDDSYPWQGGFWGSFYRLYLNPNGTVSLRTWRLGYGEDTLIAKWLYWGGVKNGWNYPNGTPNGIMPFEPYYDDFTMVGNMGASNANLTFDAGIIYGFRAQKSRDPNVPSDTAVWRWEQIRIDYAGSSGSGVENRSEMDIWYKNYSNGIAFQIWDPVGTSYGITIAPDQSPNICSLKVGMSLIMEKPRTVVSGVLPSSLVGDTSQQGDRELAGYNDWLLIQEKYGNATIHPLGCYPGTALIDKGTGDLVIVGPFWPKVEYYAITGFTWLWKENAPNIEFWIQ